VIKAENLTKLFGLGPDSTHGLRKVSFATESGTILSLLGPSGSGKSTSLRCIAGLEKPDEGEISLGAHRVFSSAQNINLTPDKRRIGMVFQSYAIWPHMTVAQNVAYPLQRKRIGSDEVNRRVTRALELVDLAHLAQRDAPNLSGGQQQRVALARAIVDEPEVLLLDEPLSNLDAKLREQMRHELLTLQRQLGLTMLYVTHDQEEALALSNHVVLMREGSVIEAGDPAQLYEAPQHRFTAEFLGLANFLTGTLHSPGGKEEPAVIDTAFGRFVGYVRDSDKAVPELFFRPNCVTLIAPSDTARVNCGQGTVTEVTFLGDQIDVIVKNADHSLRLRLRPSQRPKIGEPIGFSLEQGTVIVFKPRILS
jgi:iron(III) transport system ATP-binding protein